MTTKTARSHLSFMIALCGMSLSAATTPSQATQTINPAALQQIDQALCYAHIDGLTRIVDIIVASLRNEIISKTIRNPQKVAQADVRTKAEQGFTNLIAFIAASVIDQLNQGKITTQLIQEYYATLIYTMQLAEKAMLAKFITESLTPIDKTTAQQAVTDIIAAAKSAMLKKKPDTLEEEKKTLSIGMPLGMSPEILAAIDLQPYLILYQLVEQVHAQQSTLAETIRNYGISKFNMICRQTEKLYKKLYTHKYTEAAVAVAGAGAAAVVGLNFGVPLITKLFGETSETAKRDTFIAGVLAGLLNQQALTIGGQLLAPANKIITTAKTKVSQLWGTMKGEEIRETLSGFEVLREEDCEGREREPIGIEHVLDTILSNVEGALTRLEQGDPAPFQDIQKAFILTGKSGSGKTFAVQQLKLKFAKLNRKFQKKIVYQALTPLELKSGFLPALIEMAKQRDVALIIWIDELHLTQPVKTGDTMTLYDFLSAEIINRQNLPVWIIGASNEPGRFDNAMVRAGRFEIINIPDFTFENRIKFFAHYAREEGLLLSEKSLRLIAMLTQGCPPALLMKIILAAKQHGQVLTEAWIMDAILKLVVRVTPGFESLSLHAQTELATYIMGKAITKMVVHQKLPNTPFLNPEPVLLATTQAIQPPLKELALHNLTTNNVVTNTNIEAPRMFGKVATYEEREGLPFSATTLGKEEEVKMLLGGCCAQQVALGYMNLESQREDIAHAQRLCEELELNGLNMESLSRDRQNAIKDAAELRLNEYRRIVTEIVTTHLEALKLSAEMLTCNPQNPYLFGDEIRRIMKNPQAVRASLQKKAPQTTLPSLVVENVPEQVNHTNLPSTSTNEITASA